MGSCRRTGTRPGQRSCWPEPASGGCAYGSRSSVDFATSGRLEDQLRRIAEPVEVDYSGGEPTIRVAVRPSDRSATTAMIMAATNGSATIVELPPIWVDDR